MDRADGLDRALEVARDLLSRVDATLVSSGAPADHPIWPLARQVGSLPADAVESLALLRAEPLTDCAGRLRSLAGSYADRRDGLAALPPAAGWEGAGKDAFAAQVTAFTEHLGDDGMIGRLDSTASYVDEVAGWVGEARRAMAGILATVLTSAEAVSLRAGADEVAAAATIGARVLAGAADAYAAGRAVDERWAGRLGELPYRPPAEPAPSHGTTRAVL